MLFVHRTDALYSKLFLSSCSIKIDTNGKDGKPIQTALTFDQPFAVRVLRVIGAGRTVRDQSDGLGQNGPGLVTRHVVRTHDTRQQDGCP